MKWKNSIVIFVIYFYGKIYGLALDETYSKVKDDIVCHNICSKGHDQKSLNLKENQCDCQAQSNIDSLVNTLQVNIEENSEHLGGYKTKRQTVKELINQRNKKKQNSMRKLKILSTEKPIMTFNSNKLRKTSGLLNNNKLTPRFTEIENRLKDIKARLSNRQKLQSRGAFPKEDKAENLIKQLKDRREEILNDFKTLQSKSTIGKDTNILKERVGSINHLHNQIKSRLNQNIVDRRKENKKKYIDSEAEEVVGSIQSSSTETPKLTSQIPEIIFGSTSKVEAVSQKENLLNVQTSQLVESSTNSMSLALDKIKEKQKEAVMKIKDKLSVVKNRSKNLEILDDDKPE